MIYKRPRYPASLVHTLVSMSGIGIIIKNSLHYVILEIVNLFGFVMRVACHPDWTLANFVKGDGWK